MKINGFWARLLRMVQHAGEENARAVAKTSAVRCGTPVSSAILQIAP